MKKKMVIRVLCAALIMCIAATSALASTALFDSDGVYADLTEKYSSDENWVYSVQDSCVMDNGSVYMAVYARNKATDEEKVENPKYQIWFWAPGMEMPECVIDEVCYAGYYSVQEEMEEASPNYGTDKKDMTHPIGIMFGYGDKLCSLNQFNGNIYTVDYKDGSPIFTELTTMKQPELLMQINGDEKYFDKPQNAFTVGDNLVTIIRVWNEVGEEDRLLTISLKDGTVTVNPYKYAHYVTPYKDGKVMFIAQEKYWDEENQKPFPYDIYTMDVKSQKTKKLMSLPADGKTENLVCYSPKMDSVVYMKGNKIYATKDGKKEKQVGYSPSNYAMSLTVRDSQLYLNRYDAIHIIDISQNFSADKYLNVYGLYNGSSTYKFMRENQDVPVYSSDEYFDSADEIGKSMVRGDDSVDVLRVETSNGIFTTMRDKGYCMPLNDSKVIVDYINDLYPQFRDVAMKDGVIYGVPIQGASDTGWVVNNETMAQMGLTMDDIPKNIVDLCAFITKWNNEWAEKYPSFTPISYVDNWKLKIMDMAISKYYHYCVANGKEVDFNSDIFREMMTAVDHMQVDNLSRQSNISTEDSIGYRTELMENGRTTVGYFFSQEGYTSFDMGLTKDVSVGAPVNLSLIFVNPKTKHPQEALRLVECWIDGLSYSPAATLLQSKAAPLENPRYDEALAQQNKLMKRLQKAVDEAETDDDRQVAMENLKAQEDYMTRFDEYNKYYISPEAMDRYLTKYVPDMFAYLPPFKNQNEADQEINKLMQRYLDGQISMEQFIKEANNKARMIQLEAQ